MKPFEQGGLDSLCGIYSLVNAERMINSTPEADSQALFNEIIKFLEEEHLLASVLTEGMLLKHIRLILSEIVKGRIGYKEIHFSGVIIPPLDEFWSEMFSFSKAKNHAIILGLSGKYNHWSVVKSISSKLIKLQDSNKISQLQRSKCTTKYETGKRHHVLWPAQTLFLAKS